MIRHDAHDDLEIYQEHTPEDPTFPGMDFPLPVYGNKSPTVLSLGMLAQVTFAYGFFILVIRLIGLSYPEVALILSYVCAAAFAVALGIKLFAPERGMMEWPVWLGAAVVLLFIANRHFPDSILSVRLPTNNDHNAFIPLLFQGGIVLLIIVIYLSPSVKNLISTKTPGPLALGAVGCLLGGRWAALGFVPESDFGSWNFLACMLLPVALIIAAITDQYVRFEIATNAQNMQSDEVSSGWLNLIPIRYSALGIVSLGASLWFGNITFLNSLDKWYANYVGILALLLLLGLFALMASVFGGRRQAPNPVASAWHALTFWLTYNLQRNGNPNVFQCVPWFREPLIRLGIVGAATSMLGLSLLHLSGVHCVKGRNKVLAQEAFPLTWNRLVPQAYPAVVEKARISKEGQAVYDQWSDTLVKNGDAPLPPRKALRSLGDLLFSIALFFVGGPLLFFIILAMTQGNYIASKVGSMERAAEEE